MSAACLTNRGFTSPQPPLRNHGEGESYAASAYFRFPPLYHFFASFLSPALASNYLEFAQNDRAMFCMVWLPPLRDYGEGD